MINQTNRSRVELGYQFAGATVGIAAGALGGLVTVPPAAPALAVGGAALGAAIGKKLGDLFADVSAKMNESTFDKELNQKSPSECEFIREGAVRDLEDTKWKPRAHGR